MTIVIAGDVMLDRWITGAVDRISPEAPVPVFNFEREKLALGGAANVYAQAEVQGADAFLIGVAGVGGPGFPLNNMVRRGEIINEVGRRTTVKTRWVAGRFQVFREDRETVQPITEATQQRIIAVARRELLAKPRPVLVLSDYAKGVLSPALNRVLIDAAHEVAAPVIVGPKTADFTAYAGADLVVPNWKEFCTAAGHEPKNPEAIGHAAWQLIGRCMIGALLITRGEQGAVLVTVGEIQEFAVPTVKVVDVTGAGDTVLASIAVGLSHGDPLVTACADAVLLASHSVTRMGNGTEVEDTAA